MRPLAALLWHQTEEWVWPGSFLPWINREVLGSGEEEFPLDRRMGFAINVLFGWGLSAVAAGGRRRAGPEGLLYVSHLCNVSLHLGWAARNRRYDPGSATSVLTLLPVALAGLRELVSDADVDRRALAAGAGAGLAFSVGLPPLLRRHARRR